MLLSLLEKLMLVCPAKNTLARILMSLSLLEKLLPVCPTKGTLFLRLFMMYTKARNL